MTCKSLSNYKLFFKKLNIEEDNYKLANKKALDLLKKEYFDNELSLPDIKEKYDIRINSSHFFFKMNDIDLRNLSDSIHIAFKNGKCSPEHCNSNFMTGYHTTWDNKEVFLRSSYELDYAKQLDDYRIVYEVESKRIVYYDSILGKKRVAIPDFYLPELNMIVEIKSSYTYDKINMLDKFKEYSKLGYKTKLILDKKEINNALYAS